MVTLGRFKSHLKLFQGSLKINLEEHGITGDQNLCTALQRNSDVNNCYENIPDLWKI